MITKVSFSKVNAEFSNTLRQKVDEYFNQHNINKTGNAHLHFKTILFLSLATMIYFSFLLIEMPVWLLILLSIAEGVVFAAIGFNVMHDGAHGSYSRKKWINTMMGASLNVMGGNVFLWKQKHNMNHHSYTNIEGLDDDIDIRPYMRTNPNQPKYKMHKFQHIYWVVLYALGYISWVFLLDFMKYFSGKVANVPIKKMSLKEHVIFWTSKLLYIAIFLVIPSLKLGFAKVLLFYLIFATSCGFVISVVFQLAHVVQGTSFPVPDEQKHHIEENWTVHQLATTANFATKSKFLTFLLGGLNFQVEHHLFPKISHVHYPKINQIVKEICTKFEVKYIEYPTFRHALFSHVMHLKAMGA